MDMSWQSIGLADAARPGGLVRPLWQRLAYPLLGVLLVALGLVGWALPFLPGIPLLIVGLPLLVCFWPRAETHMRGLMKSLHASFRAKTEARKRRRRMASVENYFR